MVLYSTEIAKLVASKKSAPAVIETDVTEKPKRVRKPKVKTVAESVPVQSETEEVETLVESPPPIKAKTKKIPSEKQLENLRKGQEKRKLNLQANQEKTKMVLKKNQKQTIKALDQKISQVKTQIKKRISKPPSWFSGYIEKVKKDEAEAKPELIHLADVKKEAKQISQDSWKDGATRDRVNDEYSNHHKKMFNMIFGR